MLGRRSCGRRRRPTWRRRWPGRPRGTSYLLGGGEGEGGVKTKTTQRFGCGVSKAKLCRGNKIAPVRFQKTRGVEGCGRLKETIITLSGRNIQWCSQQIFKNSRSHKKNKIFTRKTRYYNITVNIISKIQQVHHDENFACSLCHTSSC